MLETERVMKSSRRAILIGTLPIVVAGLTLLAQDPPPEGARTSVKLQAIHVKGSRLPEQSVIALTGLRPGQTIDEIAMQKALQNANASGLFRNIAYAYEIPADDPDVILNLVVTDWTPLVKATIRIPKVDPEAVWQYLTMADPLFTRELPPTVERITLYERSINRYLESIGRTEIAATGKVIGTPASAVIFEAVKVRKPGK
jgi:hypothetical protein